MPDRIIHPIARGPAAALAADGALVRLLENVAGGQQAALHDLYLHTSPRLFGVCMRILHSRHEAEEALQDAYVAVWTRAGSFDPGRGSPMAWLVTLTRNRAIDRLRASGTFAPEPIAGAADIADDHPLASETLEQREQADRLQTCLDLLVRVDARLIRAAFFEGATYPELAARAATPLGTIKSRIRRALLKLRECLQ